MPVRTRHLAPLLLAGLLAACGAGAERQAVRTVAEGFGQALEARDGAGACARLTPQARAALAQEAGVGCGRAILDAGLRGRAPASVEVYAGAAQVDLAGGGTLFLSQGNEGWRVAAAGCRGSGDGPLDCAVKA